MLFFPCKLHGKADSEHLIGLFYLQQRDIGFLYLFDDQIEQALPFFQRSYNIRRDAKLIGQSLFAAITYADVLLNTNNIVLSQKVNDYAMQTSNKLKSNYGEASALLVQGLIFEADGKLKLVIRTLKSAGIKAKTIKTTINSWLTIGCVQNIV